MTFSNWVMLMSLHQCARTMSSACAVSGGYGEMAVERVGKRKKRRRREEVGGGWEAFYMFTSQVNFPKWTAVCSCLFLHLRLTGCSR